MNATHPLVLTAAALTDAGIVRHVNEDCVRIETHVKRPSELLAVIADGMGGHGHGDLASLLAVQTVTHAYQHEYGEPAPRALRNAIEQANHSIYFAAQQELSLRGMGTTCTAVAIRNGAAVCAHVGDSRLYLVRGGAIYAMTTDHSQVAELVTRGLMSVDEARVHEDRHVLVRALGTQVQADVECWEQPFPLRDGDRLLLCTDGLHGVASDAEMLPIVTAGTPDAACRALIALARERGGPDNITAAVIHVKDRTDD